MSYAYRQRKKNMRRELDRRDPERRQIRNAIRNGNAPRLTMLVRNDGTLPERGTRIYKNTRKRAFVLRMHHLIRYTSFVIEHGIPKGEK